MDSITKNAGDKLDAKAREFMRNEGCDYRTALYRVNRTNNDLSRAYHYAETEEPKGLSAAQKAMNELLNDPAETKVLAGFCLDSLARKKLVNVGAGVTDPIERYRRALTECQREYPNLARAAADGFLGDQDFATLALLVPSVAAEVERGNYAVRCVCGLSKATCRGKKLAKKRHVHEDDLEAFQQCIRDARQYGNELDAISCYF